MKKDIELKSLGFHPKRLNIDSYYEYWDERMTCYNSCCLGFFAEEELELLNLKFSEEINNKILDSSTKFKNKTWKTE